MPLQGLFFYHTKKVGLGVGVKWGAGVLVTHLVDEHGRSGWSAPALYKVKEAALGLIAGARLWLQNAVSPTDI